VKKTILIMFVVGLLLPLTTHALPGFMEARMGEVSGQVMFNGAPLAENLLAFFNVNKGLPPISGKGGRAPDARTFSDKDGKFHARLSQGSFYVGVLNRGPADPLGPPRQGESYYFADGGEGKLRRIVVSGKQEVDQGVIEFALPGVFNETEDSFVVTGLVVKGAGDDEPYQGALVTAKTGKNSRFRPDYISSPTGADGKFIITLPPGKSYVIMARGAITGGKPSPGEDIGKYGATALEAQIPDVSQLRPPPGVDVEIPKVAAEEQLTVKGETGQVISGLVIHMYKMPDQKSIQEGIKAGNRKETDEHPYYRKGVPLKNLLFATNSAELQGDFAKELDQWVDFLKGKPEISIEVNGYTDNVGSERYNQQLSERRAQVVGIYLVNKGIDSVRVAAVGYGKANPIADNASEDGRSKNRRVVIQLVK